MGAQYLSVDGNDPASNEVAEMLIKAGVCGEVPAAVLSATPERPSGDGWRHLAGPKGGVNDALKKIIEESGADLHCEQRVASLDEQSGQWRARPFQGAPAAFDAVVVAVPGCGVGGDNLNKIHGGYEGRFTAEQNRQLLSAQHDARWAFALFLSMDCAAKCEAFFGSMDVEKVVDKGPVHLLCYQSRKTAQLSGADPAGSIAVVAHTSLEWAKRNSRANGRDERLLWEVAEHVKELLGLEVPLSRAMLGSKVITWKQSQVTRPSPASRAHGPCMLACQSPALVLAGDYFGESNFSGCLKSGFAAADAVASALRGEKPPAQAEAASEKGKGDKGKAKGEKGKGEKGKGEKGDWGKGDWSKGDWSKGEKGKGEKGKGDWSKGGKGKGDWSKGEGKSGYPSAKLEAGDDLEDGWQKPSSKGKGKGGKKGYAWKPYTGA